jgi:hypothetical protein
MKNWGKGLVAFILVAHVVNCPAGGWWRPSPGTSWQIQYTGTLNTALNVQVYNIDLFDTPESAIANLHAQGKRVICYFSGGSYEDWRPDAKMFPKTVLGKKLDDWPGERWLDIRQRRVLLPIMRARMDRAVKKGCDAVDPDNMDGYANQTGFPLTSADQLVYDKAIARAAHARGLAVGLKNDLGQVKALVGYFDFAVNEQCFSYKECDLLLPFVQAGKPVFGIEYNLAINKFCPEANRMNFDFLRKKLKLDAWRVACR